MSDNTRMQTARGRDALHARISFHGRVGEGWLAEPKLAATSPSPPFGLRRGSLCIASRAKAGGARRNRTDDLLLAKQALSQLSYGPAQRLACQPKLAATRPGFALRATPGNLRLAARAKVGGPGKI
jgi:hypothetical protein